jgi:Amidohydrolase family
MKSRLNRRRLWVAFAAVCIGLALGWAQKVRGEGGEPRYFAITNARIVPVSSPPIESGSVVIARGLIQAVGTNVSIPPEAWVIDGKGLTVYPGLIDAGTDLGLSKPEGGEAKAAPSHDRGTAPPSGEITMGPEDRPATTPWRVAADELKADDKRIETWRNAGFTTTLTTLESGIFPGQGSVIDLTGDRPGYMVVKSAATLPISFKPTGSFFLFPSSLMGAISYVRQVLDDAAWYARAQPVYEANITRFERLPYDRTERTIHRSVEQNELILLPANNSIQILRALRLADEWKIRAALYGGQQGYAVADAIAAKKIPVLVNLKWPERSKDADPEGEQTLRELRFLDRAPSTPAVLAKSGVKFAFYSDGLKEPKEIFKNTRKAIEAGLAPEAALRALTLDAAEILGVSERLGSIQPGEIANLVVTDGDLWNEKTKVKHVFVDGRWFEIHEPSPTEKPDEKKPERSGGSNSEIEGMGR